MLPKISLPLQDPEISGSVLGRWPAVPFWGPARTIFNGKTVNLWIFSDPDFQKGFTMTHQNDEKSSFSLIFKVSRLRGNGFGQLKVQNTNDREGFEGRTGSARLREPLSPLFSIPGWDPRL